MTFTEFHSTLRENFSDIIGDAKADAPGTPFIPVAAEYIKDVCLFLRDDARTNCNSLLCLSGVDNGDKILSVVYHIESTTLRHTVALKVTVSVDAPNVSSIERVWKSANWHEREAFDLLGIVFTGHPDLRRILLPDDWEGYPLRKDFKTPEEYNGMKVPY